RAFDDFANGRRQALPHGDAIMVAMLQPLDAKLAAAGLNGLWCCVIDGDIRSVVDARLDQIFGKLDADARLGQISLDGVVNDAKTLARLEIAIGVADGGIIGERKACLIGGQRRTVDLTPV